MIADISQHHINRCLIDIHQNMNFTFIATIIVIVTISKLDCSRRVVIRRQPAGYAYEPYDIDGRVALIENIDDAEDDVRDVKVMQEMDGNRVFNENTVNAKHTLDQGAQVEDEESDVTPCIPGGDLICAGVGDPTPEDVKDAGSIRGGATKPLPGKVLRAVVNDRAQLWRDSNVKFSISNSAFSASQKRLLIAAMEEIESKSCVRFQQISYHQPDSVYVTKVRGICGADVGRRSYRGYQRLMLGEDCFGGVSGGDLYGKGIVMHELMHILGFYHEMARPDRDAHVKIHWNNILGGMEYNFDKYQVSLVNTLGLPYDYDSIMHYSKYDFSKTGYVPTVTTKAIYHGNLGQRQYLSKYDVLKLNKAYNCGGDRSLEVKPNKPVVKKPTAVNNRKTNRPDYYWY